jgi:hypothetical protein
MLIARFRLPLVTASSTEPGYAGYACTTCGTPTPRWPWTRHNPKIVSDRIGHANMACTLATYTYPSTGKERNAAERSRG